MWDSSDKCDKYYPSLKFHICFFCYKNAFHILFRIEKKTHKNLNFVVFFYSLITIHQLNYKTKTVEKETIDSERNNRFMNFLR